MTKLEADITTLYNLQFYDHYGDDSFSKRSKNKPDELLNQLSQKLPLEHHNSPLKKIPIIS